jgi:hypothetical protein
VGAGLAYFLVFNVPDSEHYGHQHGHSHQITQPYEEYHVHADFLIYLNDEKVDLSGDAFMTTSEQELHDGAHLHDGNGEVLHLHQAGVTFSEFLASLGITLSNDCLTIDGEEYCTDDQRQLGLYVNYEPYPGDITAYEPLDDDSILLYFGEYDETKITAYMNEVKDDACYYSGTCPERGVAPAESCGLTCDI